MKIQLTCPCSEPLDKMKPTSNGSYCNRCNKEVIDFSNMSDSEILSYIQKFGLSCGQFRDDQLERELHPTKTKKKLNLLYYLPVLLALIFKAPKVAAQHTQDTTQVPTLKYFDGTVVTNEVIKATPLHTGITTRRFGGAVMVVKYYKRYSLFWGLIKFKIRTRQK